MGTGAPSVRAGGSTGAAGSAPAPLRDAVARARGRLQQRLHQTALSTRLVAIVTSLLVVALVLTGVVTVALLQRVLVGQVDEDLSSLLRDDAVLTEVIDTAQDATADDSAMPADVPSDYVVQVNAADGRGPLRFQPPNQSDSTLPAVTLDEATALKGEPFTVDGDRGEVLRAVAVPARMTTTAASTGLPETSAVVVTVARSLDPVQRSVSRVAAWFVLVGLVVAGAGALLGAAAVRRAFRPLREVEAVASSFGDGETSPRVAGAPATTEVGRLGLAVNAMLDRIETSLAEREASEERMRRFVADASHELRTPLAAVRGFAELHRMGALRGGAEVSEAFSRVEDEATRMGVLVEDLLLLARLDEQRPMRREPVDLLSLAVDARTDARALAPDRAVAVVGPVHGAPPAPAVALGDDARLRQVVGNLVANALRHTPAGSPVEVGAGVREGFAVLRVIDHGPGVAPDDARRVFERFYRADPSRARHQGGGSGLGLAIVAAVVAAHGGAVRLVPTPGGGATAEVALPLAHGGHDGPDSGGDSDDVDDADDPGDVDEADDPGDQADAADHDDPAGSTGPPVRAPARATP